MHTFKKTTPAANDRFGSAVAFLGDDLLVGAAQDDTAAADAGGVFRFNATAFVTQNSATINENDVVAVTGSFSDTGTANAHVALIDWGDGGITRVPLAAGVYTYAAAHQYLDDNPTEPPRTPMQSARG